MHDKSVHVKEVRLTEAEALDRIRVDLAGFRDLVDLIDRYEAQQAPEARWVRYVDKLCPKLTHILNRGAALRNIAMSSEEVRESHRSQGAELRAQYPEFVRLADLFDELCAAAELACEVPDATRS